MVRDSLSDALRQYYVTKCIFCQGAAYSGIFWHILAYSCPPWKSKPVLKKSYQKRFIRQKVRSKRKSVGGIFWDRKFSIFFQLEFLWKWKILRSKKNDFLDQKFQLDFQWKFWWYFSEFSISSFFFWLDLKISPINIFCSIFLNRFSLSIRRWWTLWGSF